MKKAAEAAAGVCMESEVVRQVRQHGRSSMKAEICGVLIGREEGNTTIVDACIAGENAAQGGAHVTFTQDTWEHIYKIKDEKYPDMRIVGWYHSHPGFGVFLSDHDLFIHKNFFSSPRQIAWVYDPHTDEEGCFGWKGDKIKKLNDVAFRFSQRCGESVVSPDEQEDANVIHAGPTAGRDSFWMPLLRDAALFSAFFIIGAVAAFFYITSKAHLLPRMGPALVIVEEDQMRIVPPEVAVRVLKAIQAQMEAEAKSAQFPPPPAPSPQPSAAASGQHKDNDARKQ